MQHFLFQRGDGEHELILRCKNFIGCSKSSDSTSLRERTVFDNQGIPLCVEHFLLLFEQYFPVFILNASGGIEVVFWYFQDKTLPVEYLAKEPAHG